MGLKDILNKIESQRDQRIKEINRNSAQEIAAMKSEMKDKVGKEKEKVKNEFEREREIYRNLKISEGKRSVKREMLAEKERLINLALGNVLDRFGEFKGERYRRLLKKLVTESANLLNGKCKIMATRDEDIPYLKQLGIAPVRNKTVPGRGGVVVVSDNGEFRIDRTFDYMMEKQSDGLRKMTAGILFKEE
ncbi:MAG: V-type ATP synthase subunit E [Candidatus Thermoplasmatota archaeon]|jgi:vacuolar-type H+-ATPase subunit E/Vma4|nr:V-type ATP synthase subunit E [Candidatus Thermoplasmatota archaeon]MDP7265718.1 V-type ATP synthase subunit E [Candidatus Thermoplasmatota archaeon]